LALALTDVDSAAVDGEVTVSLFVGAAAELPALIGVVDDDDAVPVATAAADRRRP
jgi:hypothetical protein